MLIFFALWGQNMQKFILATVLKNLHIFILSYKHFRYKLLKVPQVEGFFQNHNLSNIPQGLLLENSFKQVVGGLSG